MHSKPQKRGRNPLWPTVALCLALTLGVSHFGILRHTQKRSCKSQTARHGVAAAVFLLIPLDSLLCSIACFFGTVCAWCAPCLVCSLFFFTNKCVHLPCIETLPLPSVKQHGGTPGNSGAVRRITEPKLKIHLHGDAWIRAESRLAMDGEVRSLEPPFSRNQAERKRCWCCLCLPLYKSLRCVFFPRELLDFVLRPFFF